MVNLKNNERGFGAIEAILIIVIVVLIGAVGYLVYENNNKTAAKTVVVTKTVTVAPKVAANPYSGWKTFSDSNFSFNYPASWQTTSPGALNVIPSDVSLTGIKGTPPSYIQNTNASANTQLIVNFFTSLAAPDSCNNGSCTVNLVTPLNNKEFPNAKLVVFTLNNGVSSYEMENTTTQKIGDTNLQEGLGLNGTTHQVLGCSLKTWPSGVVCGGVINYNDLASSSDYKNLVNVLNSLEIK